MILPEVVLLHVNNDLPCNLCCMYIRINSRSVTDGTGRTRFTIFKQLKDTEDCYTQATGWVLSSSREHSEDHTFPWKKIMENSWIGISGNFLQITSSVIDSAPITDHSGGSRALTSPGFRDNKGGSGSSRGKPLLGPPQEHPAS